MRVAVLGGSGFVGQRVCALARQAGHEVANLSRSVGCDILDEPAFARRLSELQPEAVINCAARVGSVHHGIKRGAQMLTENCQLVLNIYRAVVQACPHTLVINPLSNCCYPGDSDIQKESAWQAGPPHPSVLAYGMNRRLVYAFAELYWRQFGLRSVNWLVPNAYGPGDKTDPEAVHACNGLVIRMVQAQAAQAKQFEIWGTGSPIREWVYVDDLARILVQSVALKEQREPLNLAQQHGVSVAWLARQIADLMDYPVEFVFRPDLPDGDPKKILDATQFRQQYPHFTFVPLEAGLRETIAYYRRVLLAP